MAVPTYVGPRVTTDAGNTPSVDALLPVGTVEGDPILIIAGSDLTANTTFSAPNYTSEGNAGDATSDAQIGVLYGTATATNIIDGYVRVTQGGSSEMWAALYKHDGIVVPSISAFSSSGPANPHVLGSITTTAVDCLLFAGLSHDGADGDPFTVDQAASSEYWDLANLVDINAGTGSSEAGGCVLNSQISAINSTGVCQIDAQTSDGGAYAIIAIAPVVSDRLVTCTPEVLELVKNDAEINTSRKVGLESATTTYYFDASVSGPTDNDERWATDDFAFDGDTGTRSTGPYNGDININELRATGSTAPGSGASISQVRIRTYGRNYQDLDPTNSTRANILDGGISLGIATNIEPWSVFGWGDYVVLDAPVGGWTWAKLNTIECVIYGEQDSGSHTKEICRIDLEVTTGGSGTGTALTVTKNNATIDVSNSLLVTCSPEILDVVKNSAEVSRSRIIAGTTTTLVLTEINAAVNRARNVSQYRDIIDVFYMNAQPAGSTDLENVWTNDMYAFSSTLLLKSSTLSEGSYNFNDLQASGHTGPSSGNQIMQVRMRFMGGNSDDNNAKIVVDIRYGADLLGSAELINNYESGAWTDFIVLSTPTGGWTWPVTQFISCSAYGVADSLSQHHLYRIEFEITHRLSGTVELVLTENPAIVDFSTHRDVLGATEVLTLISNAALVNRTRTIEALTEVLVLTENQANIITSTNRDVTGLTEAILITENQADVLRSRLVTTITETLVLTENPADINRARAIGALTEVLTLIENQANVSTSVNRDVIGIPEALLLTENQANILRDRLVAATTETLILTENPADVNKSRVVSGATEVLILTENQADINRSRAVSALTEILVLTKQDALISRGFDRDVTANTEILIITESQAAINRARNVAGATEILQIVENAADVNKARTVSGNVEVLTLAELQADVNRQRLVTGAIEVIYITENPATVQLTGSRDVFGNTEVLLINENNATITFGTTVRRVIIIG